MSACIIAVGTEVTSGQINNSNTTWLANELQNLRIEVAMHLAVPDEQQAIVDAIQFAATKHQIVVLTGGLGPTNDDITRDGVAAWCKRDLKFHDGAWEKILERARQLNLQPNEQQKRQCLIPDGADVFYNSAGSAPGFAVASAAATIFVLPGPPAEVHAIWRDHVTNYLAGKVSGAKAADRLWTFDCLNITESQLAGIVESLQLPPTLRVGYRIHAPYVELKVWTSPTNETSELKAIDTIVAALSDVLVARNGEDLAQKFLLAAFSKTEIVTVADQCTQGYLATRLTQAYAKVSKPNSRRQLLINETSRVDIDTPSDHRQVVRPMNAIYCQLSGNATSGLYICQWNLGGSKQQAPLTTAFRGERHALRNSQIAAELAIKQWLVALSSS